MRNLAPPLLAALVLCGCVSRPKWKSQEFVFTLPPGTPATVTHTNVIALARVSVAPLFQDRSFTFRTTESGYERDPYAGFAIAPERAVSEAIRSWMGQSGAFGHVAGPGSGLAPDVAAEFHVNELYGDFRKGTKPAGTLGIHYIFYEVRDGGPGRILLDGNAVRQTVLADHTPAALVAAWNTDLDEILHTIEAEYLKAGSTAP